MISEALQRPIGPLAAWQWGLVVGGGYLGYRALSGKGLFPSSGTSSTSGTTTTNATGGITQGPQGDPGPVGPIGPTGPTGPPAAGPIGTTAGATAAQLARIKTLRSAIATLQHEISVNKKRNTAVSRADAKKEQSRLTAYSNELAALLKAVAHVPTSPTPTASVPITMSPLAVQSFIGSPSTTIGNAAPVQAGLGIPAPSSAVTISTAQIPAVGATHVTTI